MRRWAIVIFCLVGLLLNAGAWGASYWKRFLVQMSLGSGATVTLHCGSVMVVGTQGPAHWPRLYVSPVDRDSRAAISIFEEACRYRALGFSGDMYSKLGVAIVVFPLWFPTGIFALGLVWAIRRKRRLDERMLGGFPIGAEVSEKGSEA